MVTVYIKGNSLEEYFLYDKLLNQIYSKEGERSFGVHTPMSIVRRNSLEEYALYDQLLSKVYAKEGEYRFTEEDIERKPESRIRSDFSDSFYDNGRSFLHDMRNTCVFCGESSDEEDGLCPECRNNID